MAKHNLVNLYGTVSGVPKIFKNETTGEYVTAYCPVTVIRGTRESGTDGISDIRYDNPVILSGNPRIIEEMATWELNDMVEIKGVVTTRNITKKTKCPHCNEVNRIEGCMLTFITPIYAATRETGISKETSIQLLKRHIEVSNQVSLIGYLVNDPDYYRTQFGVDITQYPIAVNRKFRIKDDDPANKTDYPWIKSFNTIARADAKALKRGALIFVDGMIQTRDVKRKSVCSYCENEFEWADSAVEIVSYANEYLRDFNTQADIEEKQEKEAEGFADDALQ